MNAGGCWATGMRDSPCCSKLRNIRFMFGDAVRAMVSCDPLPSLSRRWVLVWARYALQTRSCTSCGRCPTSDCLPRITCKLSAGAFGFSRDLRRPSRKGVSKGWCHGATHHSKTRCSMTLGPPHGRGIDETPWPSNPGGFEQSEGIMEGGMRLQAGLSWHATDLSCRSHSLMTQLDFPLMVLVQLPPQIHRLVQLWVSL